MSNDIRPITEEEEVEVLAGLSDRTKLIAAGWVFRVLADGLGGGRTYRRLLQDLGFPSDELVEGEHAYRYLLRTAMEINNALTDDPPSKSRITEADLSRLREIDEEATPPPWRSMIEGRDHSSGEHFIMIGAGDELGEDLYLRRGTHLASVADYELIAAMRNWIRPLLDEIARLRQATG